MEQHAQNTLVQMATQTQQRAANPDLNVWVSASAGTGKTKILTDRVLNLLLRGNAPGRILCLTFTKAAAAEMQNRLRKRLSFWAGLSDADLKAELLKSLDVRADADMLKRAKGSGGGGRRRRRGRGSGGGGAGSGSGSGSNNCG